MLDDIGDCRVSDDAEAVFGEVFRVRNAVAQCRMPYGTWLVLTAPDKNAVVCVASENHRVAIGGDDASPAFGRGQRVAYLQRVGRFGRCCCQRDRAVGFGEGVCVRCQRFTVEFHPIHFINVLFRETEVARRAVRVEALPTLKREQVDFLVQRSRTVGWVAGNQNERRVSGRRCQCIAVIAVVVDPVKDVQLAAEGKHRCVPRADFPGVV